MEQKGVEGKKMEQKSYQQEYLLKIIDAILKGNKMIAPIGRQLEDLYRISEFHGCGNLVYYGVLSMDVYGQQQWKERFQLVFQRCFQKIEHFVEEENKIMKLLEEREIPCVRIHNLTLIDLYPKKEMARLEQLQFLIESHNVKKVQRLLEEMEYEKIGEEKEKYTIFYKIPGMKIIFYEDIPIEDKKRKKEVVQLLKQVQLIDSYQYLYEFTKDDWYCFFIVKLAEDFVEGNLTIRSIIDFWLYFKSIQEEITVEKVNVFLEKLHLLNFYEHLLQLSSLWFEPRLITEITEEEKKIYFGMEQYILTKGVVGIEESSTILPIRKKEMDFYIRDRKKEWLQRKKEFLFPEQKYMETMFPRLGVHKNLLWLCWGLRFIKFLTRKFLIRKNKKRKDKKKE